jgi:hypothetical protein
MSLLHVSETGIPHVEEADTGEIVLLMNVDLLDHYYLIINEQNDVATTVTITSDTGMHGYILSGPLLRTSTHQVSVPGDECHKVAFRIGYKHQHLATLLGSSRSMITDPYPMEHLLKCLSLALTMDVHAAREVAEHQHEGVVRFADLRRASLAKRQHATKLFLEELLSEMLAPDGPGSYFQKPEPLSRLDKKQRADIINGLSNALVWSFGQDGTVTNDNEAREGFWLIPYAMGYNLARTVRAMEAQFRAARDARKTRPWGSDPKDNKYGALAYMRHYPQDGKKHTAPMGSYYDLGGAPRGKKGKGPTDPEDMVMETNAILADSIDEATDVIVLHTKKKNQTLSDARKQLCSPQFHPSISALGTLSMEHVDEPETTDAKGGAVGSGSGYFIANLNTAYDVLMSFRMHVHGDTGPGDWKVVLLKAGDMVIFTGFLRICCFHAVWRKKGQLRKVDEPGDMSKIRFVLTLRYKNLTEPQLKQWWRHWFGLFKVDLPAEYADGYVTPTKGASTTEEKQEPGDLEGSNAAATETGTATGRVDAKLHSVFTSVLRHESGGRKWHGMILLRSVSFADTANGGFHECTKIQQRVPNAQRLKQKSKGAISIHDEPCEFKAGQQFSVRTSEGTRDFKVFAVGILTPSAKNIYRVLLIQNKAQGEPAFTAREYPFQVVNAGWAPKRGYVTWAAPFVLTKLDAKKVTSFLLCKKHGEPNRILSESLFAAISFDVISDEEEGEPVVSGEDGDKPDAEDEDSDESTEEDNKPDQLAATKAGSRKRSRRGTKTGNGNKRSNSQLTCG